MDGTKKIFLLALMMFLSLKSFAQFNDFESWFDIGLKKDINKSLSVTLEESIRLNQHSGNLNVLNTDLGLNFEVNKTIELKACYRIGFKNRVNGYFHKQRGSLDLTLKKEYYQLKIAYRNRTLIEKDSYVNEQTDLYPNLENRNRLKLSYNIRGKKTDPYIAYELFHMLNQGNFYQINATRYYAGLTRDFDYDIKMNLSFFIERAIKDETENTFVLHFSLSKSL